MSIPFKNILFSFLLAVAYIKSHSQIQISNFEYETEVKKNVAVEYNYNLPGESLLNVQTYVGQDVYLLNPHSGEMRGLLLNDSTKFTWVVSKKGNIGVLKSSLLHDYIVKFDTSGFTIVDTVFSFTSVFRNSWQYVHNQDFIVYFDNYVIKRITSEGLTILGENRSRDFTLQATRNHWLLIENNFFYYDGLKRKLSGIHCYKYTSELILAHSGLYVFNSDDRALYKIEVPASPDEKTVCKLLHEFGSTVKSRVESDTLLFSSDSVEFTVVKDSVVQTQDMVSSSTQVNQDRWLYEQHNFTVEIDKNPTNASTARVKFITANQDTLKTETEVFYIEHEEFDCNIEFQSSVKKGNKILLAPKNLWNSTLVLIDPSIDTVTARYLLPVKRQSDSIVTCLSHDGGKYQNPFQRLFSLNLLTLETQEIVTSDIEQLSPYNFTTNHKLLKIGKDNVSYGKFLFSKNRKENLKQKPTWPIDETFEYSLIDSSLVKLNKDIFQKSVESTNGLIYMKDSTSGETHFKVFFDYENQKKHVIPTDKVHYWGNSTYPQFKVINASTLLFSSKNKVSLWNRGEVQPILFGESQYSIDFIGSELFAFELSTTGFELKIHHFNDETLKMELVYTHTYKYKVQMIETNSIGSRIIEVRRNRQTEKVLEWKSNRIVEITPFWQGRYFDWSEKNSTEDLAVLTAHEEALFVYFKNNKTAIKFDKIIPNVSKSLFSLPDFAYIFGNYRVDNSIPKTALFKYNYKSKSLEYLDIEINSMEVKDDFCVIEAYDSNGYLWFYLLNKYGAFKLNQNAFELAEFKLDLNGIYVIGSLINNPPQVYYLPFNLKEKSDLKWMKFDNE